MARLLTPVAKFWICKRGSHFAQEAMECLGGNGYVEEGGEGVMARVYREMPLNSIWEGAGNIMALDLLRGLRKGDAVAALAQELAPARGSDAALDRLADALPARIEAMATEVEARRLAQDVALAVQAALLVQTAPPAVVGGFCASRLGGDWGHAFGTLGAGVDLYCDTALICDVLEHLAPLPSIYPEPGKGLARVLAQWADSTLFWAAMAYNFSPKGAADMFGKAPPELAKAFTEDRRAMSGN